MRQLGQSKDAHVVNSREGINCQRCRWRAALGKMGLDHAGEGGGQPFWGKVKA